MRLTCAIIDDEPLAVSLLESYVLKTPFLDLQGTYNSALDALSDLRDRPVDLLFLDIQMPELSGLEFSRILNADTRVIFTTAFDQYAVDSYRVNALDYLLKPISYPDFLASANKALRWYELLRKPVSSEEKEESASIAERGGMESIFVKSEYKLLQIELRKILPSDRFVRVHRSFIVQPEKIKVIERNRIVFGKEYIPISDNYKQHFLEMIERRSILPK